MGINVLKRANISLNNKEINFKSLISKQDFKLTICSCYSDEK